MKPQGGILLSSLSREAISFIKHLQALYFEQRDMSALLPSLVSATSWIGTGTEELCYNLEDAKAALSLESQEFTGHFTIADAKYETTDVSETVCVVYGEITARPDDTSLADIYNRFTAICVLTDDGMKLSHIHMSSPDAYQEDGHFYVRRSDAVKRETLRLRAEKIASELRDRNSQLEALTENIPGGVHQCECGDKMVFLSMSSSFLTLVGYTQEDIRGRFHNSFAEMIHPADLPRVHVEMAAQLSHGDTFELEYRIQRGDGRMLWILDQGKRATLEDGGRCFYCVLMDITRQKAEREQFRLTLERQQIIMDQTTDIIFEWDIAKDSLIFSSNWHKKFGYEAIREEISQRIPLSKNIHPEDMPAFIKIMAESVAGVPFSETEFRIRDVLGNFRWHRTRATVQYDSQGHPIKAVGVIVDIDTDKRQREHLLEQAQRDPLTNLYNKSAIRELAVQQIGELGGNGSQALLIIDIDNFKGVNDTYGHLCGDALLSDVAGVLKSHFRSSDLVGRIGGDEFLVYLPSIAGKTEVAEKLRGLLAALAALRPFADAPTISCSIGAAILPKKEADYFALYKCADSALYQIKSQGKNNFAFYDPEQSYAVVPYSLSGSAVGGIDSETEGPSDAVGDKLAQYTFRMLYNSIDINTAVAHLLEIVGRAYDVSRVYIFESSEDGRQCSNTFEWCNTGISPQLDKLQNIDYERDLGGFLKNFNSSGIFHCHDIRTLHPDLFKVLAEQGIYSVLQCAIMDDGAFMGYVGFDECRENRAWTKEQVTSLTLISNILSTFLLKLRLKEGKQHGRS